MGRKMGNFLNELESTGVDFALRPHGEVPTFTANELVPSFNTARYLGIHLDFGLTWQTHVNKKKELFESKIKDL